MSSGLHLSLIAEFSSYGNDWAVNEPLVGSIVNLSECVVIPAGNGEGGDKADTSEAEEISHVHESKSVEY